MIEVIITPEILAEAKSRNEEYFNRFGNSGTHRTNKERQRMTGYLAEACINHTFPEIQYSDDYFVDFVLDSTTIDSKAQGCVTVSQWVFIVRHYMKNKKIEIQIITFSVE